jgi:Holliday junction DNA helicase RuvA
MRATVSDNVLVALVGLGWSERVASQAVDEALASAPDAETATVPALLRLALTRLGPQQLTSSAARGSSER